MNSLLEDQPNLPNELDPNKSYFDELVGEGKKYKDQEALARSKIFADEHIKNVEGEQAALREDHLKLRDEYNKALSLQEILDQLRAQNLTESDITQNAPEDNRKPLTVDEVESLLETRDAKKRENENFQLVQSKLKDLIGPTYPSYLKEQAESLGMSAQEVDKMARTNPRAFERLFLSNIPEHEVPEAPPSSTRRSTTFTPSHKIKRDWNYYEKLRVDKPEVYWLPKTQLQMHADAKELGNDFA